MFECSQSGTYQQHALKCRHCGTKRPWGNWQSNRGREPKRETWGKDRGGSQDQGRKDQSRDGSQDPARRRPQSKTKEIGAAHASLRAASSAVVPERIRSQTAVLNEELQEETRKSQPYTQRLGNLQNILEKQQNNEEKLREELAEAQHHIIGTKSTIEKR